MSRTKDKTVFYALFEEASGGLYGDTLVNRKLYTMDEAIAYVRKHALFVFPEKSLYRRGVACQFRAASRTCYGDGTFYFVEMVA